MQENRLFPSSNHAVHWCTTERRPCDGWAPESGLTPTVGAGTPCPPAMQPPGSLLIFPPSGPQQLHAGAHGPSTHLQLIGLQVKQHQALNLRPGSGGPDGAREHLAADAIPLEAVDDSWLHAWHPLY